MAAVNSALEAIRLIEDNETVESPEDELQAWAYLIKTGLVWQLQGFYGRTATQLINNRVIDRDGNILTSEV